MASLSERLTNLLVALQNATQRGDGACLAIINDAANGIIGEVQKLEQLKEKEIVPS